MRMLFANLPVKDLAASRRFYTALGFTINEQFSDDTAACVVIEENIFVMLLREERFRDFLVDRPVADATAATEVLLCISVDTREQADTLVSAALAAGGKPWRPTEEQGPMYGGSFQDPDGHVWEVLHMDMASA